jgi:hypothetical protein
MEQHLFPKHKECAMSKCLFGCPVAIRATKAEVIERLLSPEHRALLKYYRFVLRDDPDYLRFHSSSTALRLCSVLMLQDFSRLARDVENVEPDTCCIIDALEDAVMRLDGEASPLSELYHTPNQWRIS